ncbi:MAG: hypothetical protein KAI79_08655 [Bacteroidales bacterium]|nr:hypothetical protein [Bacteroidales bacterium]
MERFTADLLFIIIVLLIAAILGFLIGYFWKGKTKTIEKEVGNTPKNEVNRFAEERQALEKENKSLKEELFQLKTAKEAPQTQMSAAPKFIASDAKAVLGKKIIENDLKIIEGIGPKIEELLKNNKISTWGQLADANTDDVKTLLKQGGSKYSMHNPTTWAEQAKMAFEGRWEELKSYQDYLDGGKSPSKK